jgi:tetratricopeptide (TPR) repeat protein
VLVRGLAKALLVLALAFGSVAHADNADAVARARTHFEAGRALYNLGNYTDAIREFSAGYQLAPRPQFLVNLGQAYRKLGKLDRAREMYRRFLKEAPPDDPDRAQVQQLLKLLDAELASRPPPAPPPAATPVTPAPSPAAGHAAPVAALTATAPPKKSFVRKNWWIFPVGAVVLTGLVVGIYFAARPSGVDCSSATLGCIHPMMP